LENNLLQPLQKAIEFLDTSGFKYAIVGGIALAQWGVVRATYDIDVKVLIPENRYEEIKSMIYKKFPHPTRQNIQDNPFIVSVVIQKTTVNFLLALPGYEELIIERATKRPLDGFDVWICSAEDLIIQKAIADRARDWPDIEALIVEQKDNLDYNYIENWLKQFSEVLEKPALLQSFLKRKLT